jgi:hypothetical protein
VLVAILVFGAASGSLVRKNIRGCSRAYCFIAVYVFFAWRRLARLAAKFSFFKSGSL